ncbi:hypothetical protein Tsubulata_012345 [Turnera subulata]|uniref:F-box/kelch-repeat protein n=1 Tax=Turnera subulata TaxID=218843 RepID=A0A9Q0F0Y9_9ROSI|nr:hypothetical protein Tsubulata_012345 [Turnera subulata]
MAAASRLTTGKKRSVCFSVEDKWGTEWYTFDLSTAGDHKVIACPCSRRIRHVTQGSPCLLPRAFLPREDGGSFLGWAVLGGGQLYAVGGAGNTAPQCLQTVRGLDLSSTCTAGGWVAKPPMLVPRCNPHTATVGGKLYVLGGASDYGRDPWGEVYDPESNTWEALPDPPFIPKTGFFSAGLEEEEEDGCVIILSVLGRVLMEYSVGAKRWKMCELPVNRYLHTQHSDGPAIAVGRVLYWYSIYTRCLYGLDLGTHALYAGKLVVNVPDHENAMLGHLGGQSFFLLHGNYDSTRDEWFHPAPALPDGTAETKFLHCLKFRVDQCSSTTTGGGGGGGGGGAGQKLNIGLESSQSFVIKYVNNDGPCFVGCVSM